MAKKPTQATDINPQAQEEIADASPSGEVVASEESTGAIVRATAVSEVTVPDGKLGSKYLPLLPARYHRALNGLVDPTEQEILNAAQALPKELRDHFSDWFESLFAEKIGFHADTTAFRVPDLRIFQGSGNDAVRPEAAIKGCVYDSDGNLVTAPTPQSAKQLRVPERFNGYVLAAHATKLFWYPKDEKNEPIPMAGIKPGDVNTNVPLCTSMDRLAGTRYGDCSTCAYRPFASGKPNKQECKDAWVFFVMREDLSTVYRVPMQSTSMSTGAKPIVQRIKGTSFRFPWSKPFTFETLSQSKGNTSWFQWKTSLDMDAENPQGRSTPKELMHVLELLARKIDATVYFPALADTYSRPTRKVLDGTPADQPVGLAEQVAAAHDDDPGANF